jgi:hypothetical protein
MGDKEKKDFESLVAACRGSGKCFVIASWVDDTKKTIFHQQVRVNYPDEERMNSLLNMLRLVAAAEGMPLEALLNYLKPKMVAP